MRRAGSSGNRRSTSSFGATPRRTSRSTSGRSGLRGVVGQHGPGAVAGGLERAGPADVVHQRLAHLGPVGEQARRARDLLEAAAAVQPVVVDRDLELLLGRERLAPPDEVDDPLARGAREVHLVGDALRGVHVVARHPGSVSARPASKV